jgi:hypothetical protein
VREVRKLTESGHQTAVLSTDYKSSVARLGPAMFARWSQENFFRYMRQRVAFGDAEGYANHRVHPGAEVGGLRDLGEREAAQLHPAQPRTKCLFRHEPIRRIKLREQFT